MKILVTIVNFGAKNRRFLDTLLAEYRSMRFDVTLVINSEVPRGYGPDVENIVGLPAEDPRSLPFAHRAVMAERIDDFDLFIFSEDDTLITEASIDAFLDADAVLPDDHAAGFARVEEYPDGRPNYMDIHSHYYWDPATVQRHGDQLFCEFTNFHAASYILTQDQLRRVLDTGRYEAVPHEGRYDMMAWAASGPWLTGALTRVVSISDFDRFLLPHLPNLYLDRLGIERPELEAQFEAIRALADDPAPERLFETVTTLDNDRWDRHAYDGVSPQLAELLGPTVRSVLTVGGGSGRLEAELMDQGKEVLAVPLDAVFTSMLAARGVPTTSTRWPVPAEELDGRRFEAVLLLDVLNHVPDPVAFAAQAADLLTPDGTLVAGVPNLRQTELKHRLGKVHVGLEHRPTFARDRLHYSDRATLVGWLEAAGLHPRRVEMELPGRLERWPLPRAATDRVAASFLISADRTADPRFS